MIAHVSCYHFVIYQGENLYAATDERVIQMDVRQCGQYLECATCHRDPHCGWDPIRNVCQRYKDGWVAWNPAETRMSLAKALTGGDVF